MSEVTKNVFRQWVRKLDDLVVQPKIDRPGYPTQPVEPTDQPK